MASYKLNIFDVLKQLDLKNKDYFSNLSKEEYNSIHPLILMKWLSGTSEARQIYFLNEVANESIFNLYKHKELLLKLLMICTSGKQKRYQWINKSSNVKNQSLVVELIKEYYNYSTKEALQYVDVFSSDDLTEMAGTLGWQKQETQKLTTELEN